MQNDPLSCPKGEASAAGTYLAGKPGPDRCEDTHGRQLDALFLPVTCHGEAVTEKQTETETETELKTATEAKVLRTPNW